MNGIRLEINQRLSFSLNLNNSNRACGHSLASRTRLLHPCEPRARGVRVRRRAARPTPLHQESCVQRGNDRNDRGPRRGGRPDGRDHGGGRPDRRGQGGGRRDHRGKGRNSNPDRRRKNEQAAKEAALKRVDGPIEVGVSVEVTTGMFSGRRGTVLEMNAKGELKVLVGPLPVRLDVSDVHRLG